MHFCTNLIKKNVRDFTKNAEFQVEMKIHKVGFWVHFSFDIPSLFSKSLLAFLSLFSQKMEQAGPRRGPA